MPPIELAATNDTLVDVGALTGLSVLYFYPMTGRPGTALPDGWDAIPGARGCTPQSCAFRDHYADLQRLGVQQIFGVSVQDNAYQTEAAERLHLPFPLLSDHEFRLCQTLHLPTFQVEGRTLIKRLTLIVRDNIVIKYFYPVFPPDKNAALVVEWLSGNC